jgi:hypothetical protein
MPLKLKCLEIDFPHLYSPLRPQTTIAIDQVKTTSSETHPNVRIAIVLFFKYLRNVSIVYNTRNRWVKC